MTAVWPASTDYHPEAEFFLDRNFTDEESSMRVNHSERFGANARIRIRVRPV